MEEKEFCVCHSFGVSVMQSIIKWCLEEQKNSGSSTAGKRSGVLLLERGHWPPCTGLCSLLEQSNNANKNDESQ